MDDKEFIKFYEWLKKEISRYCIKNGCLFDEILCECLRFCEWFKERNVNLLHVKEEIKKSISAYYRLKKKNDLYASNKIINVGTDCNLFYSEGEREDEQ